MYRFNGELRRVLLGSDEITGSELLRLRVSPMGLRMGAVVSSASRAEGELHGLDHVPVSRCGGVPQGGPGSGLAVEPAIQPSTTGSDGPRVFAPNTRPNC